MSEEVKYYDPSIILNKKDLDKKRPNLFIISTNRSAGKTTSWLKESLDRFKNTGKKTAILYRQKYECQGANLIYTDVLKIYPEYGTEMTIQRQVDGLFYELFLDNESFGYALPLNMPDQLKKYSPMFADVGLILFDEFQTEAGRYLPKEPQKLQALVLTIARGGGKQARNVDCVLLGNLVSMMNPYFIYFGIYKRFKKDTKFIRGHGWIAEISFNESSAKAIKETGIGRAFAEDEYMKYSTDNEWLINSDEFIEKPTGRSVYICTIKYDNKNYGVREYYDMGYLCVSQKYDPDCKRLMTFKASDHTQNSMMLGRNCFLWKNIRDAFNNGYLRFSDVESKEIILEILAVDLYK